MVQFRPVSVAPTALSRLPLQEKHQCAPQPQLLTSCADASNLDRLVKQTCCVHVMQEKHLRVYSRDSSPKHVRAVHEAFESCGCC